MAKMSEYLLAQAEELQNMLNTNQLIPPEAGELTDAVAIVRAAMLPRKRSQQPRHDQPSFIS